MGNTCLGPSVPEIILRSISFDNLVINWLINSEWMTDKLVIVDWILVCDWIEIIKQNEWMSIRYWWSNFHPYGRSTHGRFLSRIKYIWDYFKTIYYYIVFFVLYQWFTALVTRYSREVPRTQRGISCWRKLRGNCKFECNLVFGQLAVVCASVFDRRFEWRWNEGIWGKVVGRPKECHPLTLAWHFPVFHVSV